jgi:hypothetical protein
MKAVCAFGRFWYEFIVGDDWKIAVGVVIALAVTVGVLKSGAIGAGLLCVLGAAFVAGAFAVSLAIDVRRPKS